MKNKQQRRAIAPGICIALIIIGFATDHGHLWWLATIGILGLLFVAIAASQNRKDAALRAAKPGATRVESVRASDVKMTVTQYTAAGWEIANQSSAKSFGSQARVTITFRKP